ncbi:GTPase [Acidobacteria bacterium ACD]|nr:MAG: GTPase [Acidobacteriota bacterium]MCE7959145.1 GTPase [Acidobacteria bacterium ACB2]MDL1951758.1 GTPase [Acidobacteria bacterium ACD]
MAQTVRRVVILGAAGRDFHNFNTVYRDDPSHRVVAFTATQIPGIDDRRYPAALAGPLYPEGIPIVPEAELPELIRREKVDVCVFSYSDVTHEHVMHLGSIALAAGADYQLLGGRTMLPSKVPVVAITAVRTGAGKSQTTRYVSSILKKMGKKVVAVRHPMPYGDLAAQACQRFATYADLDAQKCTIEEREEYEPHIDNGFVVYAGVDYEKILRSAEAEADVVLWDGGNNDLPFYVPDLHLCIADPHRAGHETTYHPGEANFRRADVVVVNKCDTADAESVEAVVAAAREVNPRARLVLANSPVTCEKPELVKGKRALVIEDGPTLTHGGMTYGAGVVAARNVGAAEVVDPSPYAKGSIEATYAKYPNARGILPAMGYSPEQIAELEATIRATPCDVVVVGTPIDLTRVLRIDKPAVRVRYALAEREPGVLAELVKNAVAAKAPVTA